MFFPPPVVTKDKGDDESFGYVGLFPSPGYGGEWEKTPLEPNDGDEEAVL